jgi:broad specificity phosphatase PhoE
MPVAATQILMLRHGQSEWNAVGRWQGHADAPLSDVGRRQAAAAAMRLGTFDAVWASDLQRASHTGGMIAEYLGIGPVCTDADLREVDVGPWEGLTTDEVEAGWPGFLADHRRPDGFEPYDQAAQRVARWMHRVAAEHPGGQVLAVSHGGVIRGLRRVLGADEQRIGNLCGAWFAVEQQRDAVHIRAGDHVDLDIDVALHSEAW